MPVDIAADKDNNIWAYCKGFPDYSNYPIITYINSGISKINVATEVFTTFPLTTISSSGINNVAASKNGNLIYYLNVGLYSMSITATALPTAKIIDKIFYRVDVDPETGEIICLDDVTLKTVIYNTSGVKQYDFETSAYPNSVVFSY